MHPDPFSSAVALVEPRTMLAGGLRAGGRWAVRFPAPEKLKFFVVVRGTCFLTVLGAAPVRLSTGDSFLHASREPFTLASDLTTPAVAAEVLYADDPTPQLGEGDELLLIGAHVTLGSAHGELLLEELPPALHLAADASASPQLHWLLEQVLAERLAARPGALLASAQLTQLLFLHLLRTLLERPGGLRGGRLRALCDARLAPALRAVHAQPERAWQVSELAKLSAMSRTAFAVYFKSVAGVAPLAYLTELRMRLAERALRHPDATVSSVAASLGYSSESAFSTAFKRVTGHAPSRYRVGAKAV